MTYIYFVLDKITQFFSWLNTEVGLKPWHVQAIGITIVVVLLLLLMHLRKSRIERMHKSQRKGRSEIIGLKLSDRRTKHRRVVDRKKHEEDLIPEEETQNKPWGQTTKDWRQLREQIRKLQHDITKNQRTEEQLKKQITELKNTNEQLKEEIISHKQTENDLNKQIDELKTINEKQEEVTTIKQDSNIKQPDEKLVVTEEKNTEVEQDLTQEPVQTTTLNIESENSEITSKNAEENIQSMEEKEKTEQTETDLLPRLSSPAPASPDASRGGGRDEAAENNPDEIEKNNIEQTEGLNENHNIPLDIKELKAIADLAKRLQGGGQQKA